MQSLKNIKCFILDMDGTIYLGEKILPGAREFLAYLKNSGRDFLFLTNNSANDALCYAQKLAGMGVECSPDNILTSGEATALYLKENTGYRKIYLLGTPVLEAEFKRHGFILTAANPDCVVLGFDTTLTYEKLAAACSLIRNKTPFIATHPDYNCPTETGALPDCGSITTLIKASTGISPRFVIGKPNKEIIEAFLKKKNYALTEMAIVGDRLYTDIATGVNAGITSVLVLSGESTLADAAESEIKPDYIFANVGDLNTALCKDDTIVLP